MAFPPPPVDVEPLREGTASSTLLFGPPRSSRFASGENPIEKSYRVCSAHQRALIVRLIHESIAFSKRRGELPSASRTRRPRYERPIADAARTAWRTAFAQDRRR